MANLERKSELGKNSNQSEEKVFNAKYGNENTCLVINGIQIPCFIIDDENNTRIISSRGMARIFGLSENGNSFKKFINSGIIKLTFGTALSTTPPKPINVRLSNGIMVLGYKAESLIDICIAVKSAYTDPADINYNRHILADAIINASARTGIIALVDEALGYNREAEEGKNSLQKFFSEFLRHDAAKWVKTFPDSFFFDIYKMKGWTWKITNKHPVIVGLIIRDLVYERLAPGLLEQFDKLNPKNENGNRTYKNHQFIKEDYRDILPGHFPKIDMLAKLADYDWDKFTEMMDKVMPKYK